MKALLAGLLLLTGCVVYEPPVYRPLPPREVPVRRGITQQQAQDVAFRLAQDRALRVDRVSLAQLDSAGRWHVTLEGNGDRAAMLLDGRDGKLLKGRFHRQAAATAQPAPAPPSPPPAPGGTQEQPKPPPPSEQPPSAKPGDGAPATPPKEPLDELD